MIFRIFSVACLWFLVNGDEEFCSINGKRVLNKVSDKFLSVSIDPVVLLTGVNLSEKSLELCKHISPAFVRLAGPSTSYVNYLDDETLFNKENSTNVQITPSMWFGMNEWLALANMTPVFGINDIETTNGFWNSNSTAPLLELSDKFNLTCYWQLGYDCSNKTDTQYTEDLKLLHRLLAGFPDKRESWKIVASDFSRCHPQDQLANARKTLNSISAWVEAVMWEPETQSNTVMSKRDTIVKLLYPPTGVKFWTTIPRDSRPVSFSSALQWCKQIGDAALVGYKVVFREPRLHELFSVTPVYWLSVLHKTLMGRVVLEAKKPFTTSKSHIYAHCTKNQNQFLRSGAMTIMIINNETETYTALTRIGSFSKTIEVQSYIVTSPSGDSTDVFVNGLKLEPTLVKDNKIVFPPKHRRANAMKPISLEVPPKSIGFFVFPGARVPACIKNENDLRDIIEEIGEDQQISLSQEFTENQEPLKQRGNFESLTALQKLLKEELESDETYYEKKKNVKPDYNLLKSRMIKPYDDKLFNNKQFAEARNLLLERVKLKKPKVDNFDAKLDNIMEEIAQLKQEMGGETHPNKYRKSKVQEFPTEELEDLLKRRARLRAARKNVVFTSRELDELVSRANKKSGRLFKRGVGNTKWDDFKSKVEEKKQELLSRSPYSKPPSANARFEELRTRFSQQRDDLLDKLTARFPRMSHSRAKRQIDYKEKWNELKEQLEDKRQELLGGLNYNDILSTLDQHRKKMVAKMEMDALQNKMEEAKDKILGAMSLDEIKSRAEKLHSKLVENLDLSSFKNKIEDVKGTLLKSTNLEDLRDKFEDWTSKWKHDKVLGDLLGRRVRRDINMKMLNLKSHDQFVPPKVAAPKLTPFYHLDPKTAEEFMSSSDEFNGDLEEITTKKPTKKVDIFGLPKSHFTKFPPSKLKTKSSGLYGKDKEHPCEKEIFGNGLATVSGDDLFGRSTEKKLDDCINYFNEKRFHHNDDFIHSLSDYFKDPRGQQREDGINLSLDDDDFGQFFNRKKREVEVTKEDIEKYKLKLQNNIRELKKVIKEDRKKVVADKLRYEKEKRKNLEEGLKSKRGGDDKIVKAVNPDVEELKRQTLKRLADITDKLKTRNSKKGSTSTEVTTEFSIKSRLGTDEAQQKVSDILGQIEDKRREMQIKADLQEIMVLKKRLARRQKLLDELTGKLNNDTQTEKPASLQMATVVPSTTDKTLDLQLAATEPTDSGKAVTKPKRPNFGLIGKRRFTTTERQVVQDVTGKPVDDTVGKPITEITTHSTKIPETTTETVINKESSTVIPETTTEYSIKQARENLDNFTDDEEKFLREFFNTALYKKYEIDENTIDNPKITINDGPSVKDNSEQIDNKSEGPLGDSENEVLGSARDKSWSSSKESSEEKFKHKEWKHDNKQQRTTTMSAKKEIEETTTINPIQLTTHYIKMQNNGKFTEDKITVHPNKTILNKKESSIVKVGQENPITYIPTSNHGLVRELKDLEQKLNAKLSSKVEEIDKLQDLQKKIVERNRRSLPFGDYKSRAANLRKWRPSDILSLNSRGSFPSNNINPHFDTYNMRNNHFKHRRSIDIDADSRENEIDKDYTEDKSVYVHKIGTTTDFPTLIINPKNNDKLISFNDKTTHTPVKKTYHTKEHIQKILPKEEERMFTNFFGNLTGLLQSIGKKMENSFKSLFM